MARVGGLVKVIMFLDCFAWPCLGPSYLCFANHFFGLCRIDDKVNSIFIGWGDTYVNIIHRELVLVSRSGRTRTAPCDAYHLVHCTVAMRRPSPKQQYRIMIQSCPGHNKNHVLRCLNQTNATTLKCARFLLLSSLAELEVREYNTSRFSHLTDINQTAYACLKVSSVNTLHQQSRSHSEHHVTKKTCRDGSSSYRSTRPKPTHRMRPLLWILHRSSYHYRVSSFL